MLCMHILDLSMYLPNSGDFTVKVILSVCEILEILQDNPPPITAKEKQHTTIRCTQPKRSLFSFKRELRV